MSADETDPGKDSPAPGGVDPAILEAALEMLERGEEPDLASLAPRFEDRREDVSAALEAVQAYREHLAGAKRVRGAAQDGVLEPGTVLGDYTITGLLGRGAMGVVYRAKQGSLEGREVALKVLPLALVARDPRFLERFRREAELAAKIHAPNMAEVYDFGSARGRFFFAMRLVEGPSLAEVLEELARRRRRGETDHTHADFVRQAATLVRDVARALAVGHAAGLVHRDVKPSNLILERTSATEQAGLAGTATLVDFGLLRAVDASDLTGSMTMLGTPAFAAPEARLGRRADARSDVFSLGVVLHDLLTLTQPADRAAASAGLDGVRAMNPGVDARLAAIVTKAVEERPALRYADGEEFARDLDRYLRGDAVRALPTRPWSRLSRWVRRNPERILRRGSLAVLGVLLVATALTVGGRTMALYRTAWTGLRQDRAGDLRGAAASFDTLRAARGRASLLLGLEEAVERCDFYGEPDLAALCKALETDAGTPPDHAHEDLLRLLFSESGELYRDLGFQFLAWEMQPERSPARRVKAARTCAQYFLVAPRPLLASPSDPEPYRRELDRLEEVLVEAAREDGKEGLDLDLRRYAAGALTGMSFDSFEVLLELLHEEDLELKSIACTGVDRIWYQLLDELKAKPPIDYGRIDQELLARWATTAWSAAHEHLLGRKHKGEDASHGARKTRKDGFVARIGGDHFRWIGYLRASLHGAGLLEEWRGLPPRLKTHLLRLQEAYEEILEGEIPPDPMRLDDPRLFRGWPDAELGEHETLWWNHALLEPQEQFDVVHRDNPHQYENTWAEGFTVKEDRPKADSFDPDAPRARLFFENGKMRIDGTALGADWRQASSYCYGHLRKVPWHDSGDQETLLQLASPGESEVLFTAAKPDGALGATVHLYHEVPYRSVLPLEGTTKIEVDLCEGEIVTEQELGASLDHLAFTLPRLTLERRDDIQVRIRYLGSDAIYWLWQIVIDFEFSPPE